MPDAEVVRTVGNIWGYECKGTNWFGAGKDRQAANLELFKAIVERGFSQGDLTVADEVCAVSMSILQRLVFPARKS